MGRLEDETKEAYEDLTAKFGNSMAEAHVLALYLLAARDAIVSLGLPDQPHKAKDLVRKKVASWRPEKFSETFYYICPMLEDERMHYAKALFS